MTDESDDTRWWLASDGHWYPPPSGAQDQPPGSRTLPPPPTPTPTTEREPGFAGWWDRQTPKARAVLVGMALLVVAAIAVGGGLGEDASQPVAKPRVVPTTNRIAAERASAAKSEEKAKVRRLVAFDICKDFVKQRLKSPSSAKFRNPLQDDGEVLITGSGNGPFEIRSTVDAENSFGAKPRSTFVCVVTLTGDTWHLDNLTIV